MHLLLLSFSEIVRKYFLVSKFEGTVDVLLNYTLE